jgi:hypothetical protein
LRKWTLVEEGIEYGTCEAASLEAALEIARDNVDASNYEASESTLWIDVSVREICSTLHDNDDCDCDLEKGSSTVQCDPAEPDCEDDDASYPLHSWSSPSWLGGCDSNPGVWGHGGGCIIHEVCQHCGLTRITDTWAQRPDTGEQGLTSVEYSDVNQEEWLRRKRSRALRKAQEALQEAGYVTALGEDCLEVESGPSEDWEAVQDLVEAARCEAYHTGSGIFVKYSI